MRTVIALGGNAIAGEDAATVAAQRERIGDAAARIATLVDDGHEVVLTHGNGPQVGRRLVRQERADAPERPLDVLVAETQAQIGYLIASELGDRIADSVASVVTRARVDPDDPDFEEPSKPIGPYYTASEAEDRPFETGTVTTPQGGSAYRRLVPSPDPIAIPEVGEIEALVDSGAVAVCGGGGGIPVVDEGDATTGVAAVVDKDHTTSLVARAVAADCLVMATDVDCAYRDFGTTDQRPIRSVDASTMRDRLEDGEFAAGSMEPKVEACLQFLDDGGDRAVITALDSIEAGIAGTAGTLITD